MPNVKISAAADAGTLLSNDMLPLARSGDTNAYHTTPAAIAVFTNASVASGAYGNIGRNLFHNAQFRVQQRGQGPWTVNPSYTADRWVLNQQGGDTISVTVATLADADRTAIGDQAAEYGLQNVFTGSATTNSYNEVSQRIEDVRRLAGKACTLSFWAHATSGTPKVGVYGQQVFGTGGSPSATVNFGAGATAALSTTWTRYTLAMTPPSAVGKTFGATAGTDYTDISLIFSDVSNQGGTGIGQQSGTVQLWGVQFEVGTVATPLEKVDPQVDLAKCERFYQTIGPLGARGYNPGTDFVIVYTALLAGMRGTPAVTISTVVSTNIGTPYVDAASGSSVGIGAPTLAGGVAEMTVNLALSADL